MALDIYFLEDIRNTLTALEQASERLSELAEIYGMDREAARLYHLVYTGALSDVARAFGLALAEPVETTLQIPARMKEVVR